MVISTVQSGEWGGNMLGGGSADRSLVALIDIPLGVVGRHVAHFVDPKRFKAAFGGISSLLPRISRSEVSLSRQHSRRCLTPNAMRMASRCRLWDGNVRFGGRIGTRQIVEQSMSAWRVLK